MVVKLSLLQAGYSLYRSLTHNLLSFAKYYFSFIYSSLYRHFRKNAIAIESEARDPFGGNVYYVTMQITFLIPEFAHKERNLHCDVVHITTKWVCSLTLGCKGVFAIKAYTSPTVERNLHGRPGLPGQRSQTVLSSCHYHTCTVNITEDIILKRERFVVIMYCRTSGDMNVNTAWMTLFSQMSRNIDNNPPPQAALYQHVKRSSYQSGHMWGQSLKVQPERLVITYWGWETSQNAGYIPKWTTLPIWLR